MGTHHFVMILTLIIVLAGCAPEPKGHENPAISIEKTSEAIFKENGQTMTAVVVVTETKKEERKIAPEKAWKIRNELCSKALDGSLKKTENSTRPNPPYFYSCRTKIDNVSLPENICKEEAANEILPILPTATSDRMNMDSVGTEWIPSLLGAKTLVCASMAVTQTGQCNYGQGVFIRLYRMDTTVSMVDIESQSLLAQTQFTGKEPTKEEKCPSTINVGRSITTLDEFGNYANFSSPEVQDWLKKQAGL